MGSFVAESNRVETRPGIASSEFVGVLDRGLILIPYFLIIPFPLVVTAKKMIIVCNKPRNGEILQGNNCAPVRKKNNGRTFTAQRPKTTWKF
jgi:hypothetical protein